ncbi:CGNR zinc finger domain-containing protein [Nonomuraea sp. NPDC050556]|uniref:CGNR zinc finger domain-containing protein n=1 Tax=Nonomuraea sp. NPDC050556 TaxID=3364369 RepID=UPI0037B5621E
MDVEFPILGTEPLVVEFANTLYGLGDQMDYLHDPQWIDLWFARVAPEHTAMGAYGEQVRTLRDTIHAVLSAATEGRDPDAETVRRLNAFAAAAPTCLQLDWSSRPTARWLDTVHGPDAALGRIATCCIELLTGTQAENLRRCQGPGCSLFFVKNHPRRRWCDPSCGHRDRQARYYRRHLPRGGY